MYKRQHRLRSGNCPSLASAEVNADTGNGIPDAYDHGVNSLTLAHQGGWDEILMVAGPVLIFAWLLSVARKRAQTLADAEAVDSPESGPTGSVSPPS